MTEQFPEVAAVEMSGAEVRDRFKRGRTIVARYSMEAPRHGRGDPVKVRAFARFTVCAIGTGRGPDVVVAYGEGREVAIPSWALHAWEVAEPAGVAALRSGWSDERVVDEVMILLDPWTSPADAILSVATASGRTPADVRAVVEG
jgi:hypothetical protein